MKKEHLIHLKEECETMLFLIRQNKDLKKIYSDVNFYKIMDYCDEQLNNNGFRPLTESELKTVESIFH